MKKRRLKPWSVVRRNGLTPLLPWVILGLALTLGASTAPVVLRAQPSLLEMAVKHPEARLNLIVQKSVPGTSAEALVTKLGGTVTRDLSIINAFSAEVPGRSVPQLAQAAGVRWVSLDAPVRSSDSTDSFVSSGAAPTATDSLASAFDYAVRAPEVWNGAPTFDQGQGVTIAVVDSGILKRSDVGKRLLASGNFNSNYHNALDLYGHGTFVASLIAGDGTQSKGQYIGIAPKANILNVRISNDQGQASESDTVSALEWVLKNKTKYNIRVVNLSLNSAHEQSYHTSPLAAATEILWFNRIVVVVSAGNRGVADLYPPANDPFVITVGATNDLTTRDIGDDVIAPFSSYGTTELGTPKPELVAPGTNIIAYLPENAKTTIGKEHPANAVSRLYFRMSGTSMAAPIVSGGAALLLQAQPSLNPDQVKYRLMATANKNWPGYDPAKAGAGYLDIYAAVHGTTTGSANADYAISQLLFTGDGTPNWNNVNWNNVNWSNVNWSNVNWSNVLWNDVSSSSDYWGQ